MASRLQSTDAKVLTARRNARLASDVDVRDEDAKAKERVLHRLHVQTRLDSALRGLASTAPGSRIIRIIDTASYSVIITFDTHSDEGVRTSLSLLPICRLSTPTQFAPLRHKSKTRDAGRRVRLRLIPRAKTFVSRMACVSHPARRWGLAGGM